MAIRIPLVILTFLCIQHTSFGQSTVVKFYQIIKDDSVVFFFNERHRFTEENCSDFVRYTRVDDNGYFHGYYEDFDKANMLMSKGHYVHGKKNGYFELYHPNGNIKCRGNYVDHRPSGNWEYFYENGLPERTIRITETDTLLLTHADKKGNLEVVEGNGNFSGLVAGKSNDSNLIIARGKVENGKPHGKWSSTSLLSNAMYCKETFDHGNLIRGSFPNAVGGDKRYSDGSFLNSFFLATYLYSLEEFRLEKCADSTRYSSNNYSSFNLHQFRSELRVAIDRIIENDFRTGKAQEYSIGDNYLTIQFSVNKEGKAERFAVLTGWGHQFMSAIAHLIRTQAKSLIPSETHFFHLKLNFPGGFVYRYSFHFSKKPAYY